MTNLCTKFHLNISMYNWENEQKLNLEWRKGVTLCAPAILWRGHKKCLTHLALVNLLRYQCVNLSLAGTCWAFHLHNYSSPWQLLQQHKQNSMLTGFHSLQDMFVKQYAPNGSKVWKKLLLANQQLFMDCLGFLRPPDRMIEGMYCFVLTICLSVCCQH